jgi:hypothetical protein
MNADDDRPSERTRSMWVLSFLLVSSCSAPSKYKVVDSATYRALAEGRESSGGVRAEALRENKAYVLPELHYGFATVLGVSGGIVTPIPAGTFTLHPFKGDLEPIGVELIGGGALAPGNGETNISVAGGLGISYPIMGGGYFTIGYVGWSDDNDSHNGLLIGFTFGSNPVPTHQ